MPDPLKVTAASATASGVAPAAVFLRQRYPGLRFEIYVDHPSYELRELLSGKAPTNVVNSTWKVYLRAGIKKPNFSTPVITSCVCVISAPRVNRLPRSHGGIWAFMRRSGSLQWIPSDRLSQIYSGEGPRARAVPAEHAAASSVSH